MIDISNNKYLKALLAGFPGIEDYHHELKEVYEIGGLGFEEVTLKPLTSIVGNICDKQLGKTFSPKKLSNISDNIWPDDDVNADVETWKQNAQNALKKFHHTLSGSKHYHYSLYHFLHSYGARISYGSNEDASLFDHNRILGAISACLDYNNGTASFWMIKGAISGIQKYIYHNIKAEQIGDAEKAGKRLRGRSFQVAFLNQVIAESIVEKLGLEQANILFVGGGHFTLLIPKNKVLDSQLDEVLEDINLGLLQNIGPQISLVTAQEETDHQFGKSFASLYRDIGRKLETNKQRKYHRYLSKVFNIIEEQKEDTEKKLRKQREKEAERIGALTPYADYILEVKGTQEQLDQLKKAVSKKNRPAITSLSFLGKHFYIIKNDLGAVDQASIEDSMHTFLKQYAANMRQLDSIKLVALNQPDLMHTVNVFKDIDLDIAYGFRFLGKYAPYCQNEQMIKESKSGVPVKIGDVLTFDDIAQLLPNKEQLAGLVHDQLGVMRLDVDDLGTIFARGLGRPSEASIERLLCLSREFQLFFGGYFNHIAKKHHIYITYSGGDDAFVIGSWLNILLFARQLEADFQKFTCGNEQVHFSGGIFICNPHYPIPRLQADAGDMEKKAKKYPAEADKIDKQKNALHVFNHTLPWSNFQAMMNFEERLSHLLPDGEVAVGRQLHRSLFRRFLRIIQTNKEVDIFERYRSIAGLHSLLARQGYGQSEMKKKPEQLDEAGLLIQELLQKASSQKDEDITAFDHYTIPLHIALYKTKK